MHCMVPFLFCFFKKGSASICLKVLGKAEQGTNNDSGYLFGRLIGMEQMGNVCVYKGNISLWAFLFHLFICLFDILPQVYLYQ